MTEPQPKPPVAAADATAEQGEETRPQSAAARLLANPRRVRRD